MNWISKLVKGKYDEKTQTIGKKESRKKGLVQKEIEAIEKKSPLN